MFTHGKQAVQLICFNNRSYKFVVIHEDRENHLLVFDAETVITETIIPGAFILVDVIDNSIVCLTKESKEGNRENQGPSHHIFIKRFTV